jgi:hypothetical protein
VVADDSLQKKSFSNQSFSSHKRLDQNVDFKQNKNVWSLLSSLALSITACLLLTLQIEFTLENVLVYPDLPLDNMHLYGSDSCALFVSFVWLFYTFFFFFWFSFSFLLVCLLHPGVDLFVFIPSASMWDTTRFKPVLLTVYVKAKSPLSMVKLTDTNHRAYLQYCMHFVCLDEELCLMLVFTIYFFIIVCIRWFHFMFVFLFLVKTRPFLSLTR